MREEKSMSVVLSKEPKGKLEWGTNAAPIVNFGMSSNHIRVKYTSDL